MAGRKKLVLTQQEIISLAKHIENLPFKRKMEEEFLEITSQYESMKQLTQQDINLLQRCRYERNAYQKRIIQLQLIQKIEPQKLKKLELNIIELNKRTDIDSYFAMHDALTEILKIKRNQTSEKNLTTKIERVLNLKEDQQVQSSKSLKKQQDHIKYFIGSLYLNLLNQSGLGQLDSNQNLDLMLDLFKTQMLIKDQDRKTTILFQQSLAKMEKLIQAAKQDPRNPFNKSKPS